VTILSVTGKPSQSARILCAAVLGGLLSACSVVKNQLQMPGAGWPHTDDPRVVRDGDWLRVRTKSFDGARAAHDAAESALKAYLEKLKVLGGPNEREARIKAALERAAPVDGLGVEDVNTTSIDVRLQDLQQLLGTSYE
jgi:hypothetical protein